MKIVLDDTAKEQINIALVGIKFVCDLHDDCAENECPFCIIDKSTKLPQCMFSSLPYQWDTIK